MIVDACELWPTKSQQVLAKGNVQNFVQAQVVTPAETTMVREWTDHCGAVAIMAVDEQFRVGVIDQYRHPVAMRLIEPPAGILDIPGEDALEAAKRELAEEAGLAAENWAVLVDFYTSPGGSAESIRVYLATGLKKVARPADFEIKDEEAQMSLHWVNLNDLVSAIYEGKISNPSMVIGALSLSLAKANGKLSQLRDAHADWPAISRLNARHAGLLTCETK